MGLESFAGYNSQHFYIKDLCKCPKCKDKQPIPVVASKRAKDHYAEYVRGIANYYYPASTEIESVKYFGDRCVRIAELKCSKCAHSWGWEFPFDDGTVPGRFPSRNLSRFYCLMALQAGSE